ncbi:1892_t:CDS:2 [Diversispora eburnea]|uniref:1892_t:CDS:1 n=1 Tax=Diversispora eburnea TaxID=1213867 RepID=A0A9N9BSD3_9GLOM|nr:1892_t:CDS:2 [Diversispora eburnea]
MPFSGITYYTRLIVHNVIGKTLAEWEKKEQPKYFQKVADNENVMAMYNIGCIVLGNLKLRQPDEKVKFTPFMKWQAITGLGGSGMITGARKAEPDHLAFNVWPLLKISPTADMNKKYSGLFTAKKPEDGSLIVTLLLPWRNLTFVRRHLVIKDPPRARETSIVGKVF